MTTFRRLTIGLVGLCAMLISAASAQAGIIYASTVETLLRGDTSIGFSADFYGGTFPGSFPVVLTPAQAEAAVLGPPDGDFLTLPGNDDHGSGVAFPDAFVEVSFGTLFGAGEDLVITELGADGSSARIFLFRDAGGHAQFDIVRGAADDIVMDLAPFAALAPFKSVGIGGLDLNGGSPGFDLDAVGIRVPEPGTVALLGLGLAGFGVAGYRRR